MSISEINHYAIESAGISIYDEECLTALQLSARTAGKVNEVVKAVNENTKLVNEANQYMRENIEETTEEEIKRLTDDGTLADFINNDLLQQINANVNSKADKHLVMQLTEGTPRGGFATVVDLTRKYPQGNNYIYVVEEDNGWYYWDNAQWNRGGSYLAPVFGEGQVRTNALRYSEITLCSNIYYDERYNKLTIPKDTYFTDDYGGAGVRAGFIATGATFNLDVTLNSLYWVMYNPRVGTCYLRNNDSAFETNERVVCAVYNRQFFGKNVPHIIRQNGDWLHTDNIERLRYFLNHKVKRIKGIGDSIMCGVGANGTFMASDPSKKTIVYENGSGKYYNWCDLGKTSFFYLFGENAKIQSPMVIAPDTTNITYDGEFDISANNEMPAYFVSKFAKEFSFKFIGNTLDLYFLGNTDTGVVNVWVDYPHTMTASLDTSSAEPAVKVLRVTPADTTIKEHTCRVYLSGAGAETTSDNVYIRFGGGKVTFTPTELNAMKYYNYGISGIDSWTLDAYVGKSGTTGDDRTILIEDADDIVLLCVGTNDRLVYQTPDTTRAFVREIVKKIHAFGKPVILMTPPPHPNEASGDYNFTVGDVASAIKEVAQEMHCACVDVYSLYPLYCATRNLRLMDSFKDGLHPNDTGNLLIAKILADTLGI